MTKSSSAKPFLKWAGGKTQLLEVLSRYVPTDYGKYIEPFIGGGALFFRLQPRYAVISDSNAELIQTYKVVRDDVEQLIDLLKGYPHDEAFYYNLRSQNPNELTSVEGAARFIYLNRTCYNGLYRVNKKGQFNVPFGLYQNPTICDEPALRAASEALAEVVIEVGDYQETLDKWAEPGDFVFLDPPYFPISQYSDFKRYTKKFFYEEDQVQLAARFRALADKGVYMLLTNSNAPLIRELYGDFSYEVASTNRNINSKGAGRTNGQDLIVAGHNLMEIVSIPRLL